MVHLKSGVRDGHAWPVLRVPCKSGPGKESVGRRCEVSHWNMSEENSRQKDSQFKGPEQECLVHSRHGKEATQLSEPG